MIRRFAVLAAVVAIPVGTLGAFAGGTAYAGGGGTPQNMTCHLSGTFAFDGTGISTDGNVGTAKTSTTTATTSGSGAGCDTSPSSTAITQKNTKCTGTNTPYPGCVAKDTTYGSAAAFAAGNTASILKALKKGITTTDNGLSILLVPTAITAESPLSPPDACGSEAGFLLTGTVKKTSATFSLLTCLEGDTGTKTTDNFVNDLTSAYLGNTAIFITSATYDSTLSELVVTA
jgi:hypothetical protein